VPVAANAVIAATGLVLMLAFFRYDSLMKFNDKQIEGFTKFLDTMAASAFVGAIVGATGHTLVTRIELIALCLSFIGCLISTTALRSSK
jgi:hypothetical protein